MKNAEGLNFQKREKLEKTELNYELVAIDENLRAQKLRMEISRWSAEHSDF